MGSSPAPFRGEGTVLCAHILAFEMTGNLSPEAAIARLGEILGLVAGIIEKHSGTIVQLQGDNILAYWNLGPHAQEAFDAACEIVRALGQAAGQEFPVQIVLGTGEMGGDIFGSARLQFQIVGKALAVIDRLSKAENSGGSFIRMSQYTAREIKTSIPVQEKGKVERDDLEPLEIYELRPANNG